MGVLFACTKCRDERRGRGFPAIYKLWYANFHLLVAAFLFMNTEQRLLVITNKLIKEREDLRNELKKTQEEVAELKKNLDEIYT